MTKDGRPLDREERWWLAQPHACPPGRPCLDCLDKLSKDEL